MTRVHRLNRGFFPFFLLLYQFISWGVKKEKKKKYEEKIEKRGSEKMKRRSLSFRSLSISNFKFVVCCIWFFILFSLLQWCEEGEREKCSYLFLSSPFDEKVYYSRNLRRKKRKICDRFCDWKYISFLKAMKKRRRVNEEKTFWLQIMELRRFEVPKEWSDHLMSWITTLDWKL